MVLKEVTIDSVLRRYYLYRPAGAGSEPLPLLLAFHGGGGKAEGTDRCAGGLTTLADQKKFMIVFPDGIDRHWSDGRPSLVTHTCDDLSWISGVIDHLISQALARKEQVYATGISNGGFFSQYLALKLSGKIAAVASVAASLPLEYLELESARPVPIMFLLGTTDTMIPWQGGRIGGKILPRSRGDVISASQSVQFWLKNNKNSAKAVREPLHDRDPSDGCVAFEDKFGAPGSPTEVVLVEIQGGGHTWPGGSQYLPARVIGPVCRDFDGNAVIWEFLSRHRLKPSHN